MKVMDVEMIPQVNSYVDVHELEVVKNLNEKKETNSIIVMKRHEMKYVLNEEQLNYLVETLKGHMVVDKYGQTSIASIYYDTVDHRLIRNSIEKPNYKEKIRLRSYGLSYPGKKVFLELKRKVNGVTYKRRVALTEEEANDFLSGKSNVVLEGQIGKEITYFRDFYKRLTPSFLIIADRTAYYQPNGDLRLTIDRNPRYRVKDMNLSTSMEGEELLPNGGAILEIKVQQAMPLWLSNILANGKIYKSSFSKVGEAYKIYMKERG